MLKKLFLYLRTLKYLKAKQICYQIYYRLFPAKSLDFYIKHPARFFSLDFSIAWNSPKSYNGKNCFSFLNRCHQFQDEVDWNFLGYGKLWNYNLQYLHYLNQKDVLVDVKKNWLRDIGTWLMDGRLKLEPYPVSLRVINCIKFLSSHKIDDTVIVRNIFGQLKYLAEHLEYHILGNHLLENSFALLMGGHAFRQKKWEQKAKAIIYRELKEQILEDGCHFERSPMYHQTILFRLLELIDWYKKSAASDHDFLEFVGEKASRMQSCLHHLTFQNGDIPLINDSSLDIAPTTKQLAKLADSLSLKSKPDLQLQDSGFRKYQLGNYECLVDAGEIKATYQPGHTHAGALSFVLYYQQLPIIVDVGTSTYEKGNTRHYERSTCAHNTVSISDQNQTEVWDTFRVGRRASITLKADTGLAIIASHDGYKQNFDAAHERSFSFEKHIIKITDIIYSSKKLTARAYFHFHPDCHVQQVDDDVFVNNSILISFSNKDRCLVESYQYAKGFNLYEEAKVLIVEFQKTFETLIAFSPSVS